MKFEAERFTRTQNTNIFFVFDNKLIYFYTVEVIQLKLFSAGVFSLDFIAST